MIKGNSVYFTSVSDQDHNLNSETTYYHVLNNDSLMAKIGALSLFRSTVQVTIELSVRNRCPDEFKQKLF